MEDQKQIIPPQNTVVASIVQETKPKMKLWKKTLITLSTLVILAIVTFYNLPRILTFLYPNDAILVDNSELLLKKIDIPDSDNGFFDLNQITNQMIKVPEIKDAKFLVLYTDFSKPVVWDQKLVDQVLNDNKEVFSLFDQASNKSHFQIPSVADPVNIKFDGVVPPMINWRDAGKLQSIKVMDLARKGKYDQALIEAVKINKVGHQIISGQNGLVGLLVGIAVKDQGSNTILKILSDGNYKNESLSDAGRDLSDISDNLEGYKNALRFEYMVANSVIDKIKESLEESIKEDYPKYYRYSKFGYYFKINQTKNLFTDFYSVPISTIGSKCNVDSKFLGQVKSDIEKYNNWKVVFYENAIGRMISSILLRSVNTVVNKQCQTDLLSDVAIIEIALKAYQNDNKKLPQKLDELVPKYLESIPEDPFDHKPIRYSAEKKILYSVGLNQKDLGGSVGDDWRLMENPTFKIAF